jgi:hypothetical protein
LYYGQDAQYGWDTSHTSDERFARDTETSSVNPLVTDNVTGLVWQGCAAGLTGASCTTGTTDTYTWTEALAYCDALSWGGYSDWRLPDRYELMSIADLGTYNPCIDTTTFPATPIDMFWSSSSFGIVTAAWRVWFVSGYSSGSLKGGAYNVRCVRGGP